ncbi:hypothetical protein RND71_039718 [Anisodus tanguticus]|uniref:Uncharacterized protein n=1 Tax=Anisodus tanguticus TaxID=243964 RepID=A0AAE1QZP1_9SOLA|nr:hypothetical protein RND71_039718 [Anisodus tanguticus]
MNISNNIRKSTTNMNSFPYLVQCHVSNNFPSDHICTVGSLKPTFVPARWVGLAVKLPSASALEGQSPPGPRKPLHASVTFWEAYAP